MAQERPRPQDAGPTEPAEGTLDPEDAARALLGGAGATATVYVALAGESVDAWRPVVAEAAGEGLYRLPDHKPPGERWAFPPATLVHCEPRVLDGREVLVAVAAA